MNTEVIGRMMEAKKYQMMAIKALFPEGKQEHIDNIEKELKAMFSESMMECMMKCMGAASDIKAQADAASRKIENMNSENADETPENEEKTENMRSENADKTSEGGEKSAKSRTKKTSGSASVKKEKVHKVTID